MFNKSQKDLSHRRARNFHSFTFTVTEELKNDDDYVVGDLNKGGTEMHPRMHNWQRAILRQYYMVFDANRKVGLCFLWSTPTSTSDYYVYKSLNRSRLRLLDYCTSARSQIGQQISLEVTWLSRHVGEVLLWNRVRLQINDRSLCCVTFEFWMPPTFVNTKYLSVLWRRDILMSQRATPREIVTIRKRIRILR
jgi:hypothetical protein